MGNRFYHQACYFADMLAKIIKYIHRLMIGFYYFVFCHFSHSASVILDIGMNTINTKVILNIISNCINPSDPIKICIIQLCQISQYIISFSFCDFSFPVRVSLLPFKKNWLHTVNRSWRINLWFQFIQHQLILSYIAGATGPLTFHNDIL